MPRTMPVPHQGVGTALVLVLCAAVLPVAAVITFGIPVPFIAAVAAGYVLQIGIILVMASRWRVQPGDPWLAIALIYGLSQLITLVSSTVMFGDYEPMDLVSALSKVVGVVLYAGLIYALVPTEGEIRRFLGGVLTLAIGAMTVNVYLNAGQFSKILTVSSSYGLDFSSFFANRNQFGSFLFMSIVAHGLYLHGKKLRWFNVILFAAQIASLFLTMSRGAILAFLVFVFAFGIMQFRARPKYLVSFTAIGVSAILVGLYFELDEVFHRVILRSESGLSGRDSLWGRGLDVWSDNNVFFGVGTFSGLDIARDAGMNLSEFHSFWIETLVSGGVVELGLIVLVLGIVWLRLARSSLDLYRRHLLYCAALGLLVLSCVESISFFSIGLVGTMYSIFLVAVPLLYASLDGSMQDGTLPARRVVGSAQHPLA